MLLFDEEERAIGFVYYDLALNIRDHFDTHGDDIVFRFEVPNHEDSILYANSVLYAQFGSKAVPDDLRYDIVTVGRFPIVAKRPGEDFHTRWMAHKVLEGEEHLARLPRDQFQYLAEHFKGVCVPNDMRVY